MILAMSDEDVFCLSQEYMGFTICIKYWTCSEDFSVEVITSKNTCWVNYTELEDLFQVSKKIQLVKLRIDKIEK